MAGETPTRRGTSGQITRGLYQGYYGSLPEAPRPEAPPAAPAAAAEPVPTAELPPVVVTAQREPQRQRQAPRQRQQSQRWDEDAVYRTAAQNINEGRVQVAEAGQTVGLDRDTTVQGQRNHRAPPLRTPTV